MAFGWLQLTSNLGAIIGGLFSLLIAPHTFLGIPGWRVSFHLVAIVSIIVGILVRIFATDPHIDNGTINEASSSKSFKLDIHNLLNESKLVMRIPSFQIIVAQGVTGSFPWSALSFAPMWLELTGFSHEKTAVLIGMFVIGNSLGGLFGGRMGDFLAKRHPNSGRIILSQLSSGSGIPLAAILLLAVPGDPSTPLLHGLLLFVTGFFISWNAPATNNPIFAEIVPEKSRTSIYALDRSFESILSSFAPPTVGLLAQYVYGYKPVPEGTQDISTDRENAASLAKSLFAAIAIPMALCCVIYSFLYVTYPRDRERARMEATIASEMELIESNSPVLMGIQSSEAKELNLTIDDDASDYEESDERTLIHHKVI
ncbi:uncharacterized protein LOC127257185 isoform X3 [Andrographis paniculata]|nr:uncharacterized protein LOC127257185 isoform X3 [Andrographis paniculata]